MRPINTIGLTVVAAAIVGLYGCGKEEPKQAAAPKTETAAATPAPAAAPPADEAITVKIGSAGPLTGEIAHLGKDNDNGVRLAIDQANDKKIKLGGKTVKFEVESEDDQADPKLGPTIAQKFADAILLSDKNNRNAVLGSGLNRSLDFHRGTAVAAHRIDCDLEGRHED